MATVVFDYAAWSLRFPALVAAVPAPLANVYFAEAGLFLYPGDGSRIADPVQRLLILNLIVAHIAALNDPNIAAGMVGRIAGASEGSVSVTMSGVTVPGSAEWYAQTRFGLQAWAALAPARTMRYVPAPAYRSPRRFN